MCKACDGWGEYLTKKDFRHGKVEVSDFDDEIPYRKAAGGFQYNWKRKKPRKKTRPGCVANDFGPHIFVWTTEQENEKSLFFKFFGFHKYQREICCGCGKRRGTELSERYIKRKDRAWEKLNDLPKGEPVSRYRYANAKHRRVHYSYFTWEDYNEEYTNFRKEEVAKRGILNVDVDGRWFGLY